MNAYLINREVIWQEISSKKLGLFLAIARCCVVPEVNSGCSLPKQFGNPMESFPFFFTEDWDAFLFNGGFKLCFKKNPTKND